MTVPPDLIAQVREQGRQRRRLTKAERQRVLLAGVVDTGNLSDDDVATLAAAYRAGQDEPVDTTIPSPNASL